MTKNMGNIDRLSRTSVGVIVAVLYFTGVISGTLGIVLLSLATIFVLSSLISFCPLYTLFGIQTSPSNTKG